jgi:uncharacterized protein (DUF1778 family)
MSDATLSQAGSPQRGAISLRIDNQVRSLIDQAAALVGKTRTDFLIDSARQQAMDVLLDQSVFRLPDGDYDSFVEALDSPPPTDGRIQALLNRKPIWERDA